MLRQPLFKRKRKGNEEWKKKSIDQGRFLSPHSRWPKIHQNPLLLSPPLVRPGWSREDFSASAINIFLPEWGELDRRIKPLFKKTQFANVLAWYKDRLLMLGKIFSLCVCGGALGVVAAALVIKYIIKVLFLIAFLMICWSHHDVCNLKAVAKTSLCTRVRSCN